MYILGVPDTRETRPADIRAMREQIDQILCLGELVQVGRPTDTALEKRRGSHDDEATTTTKRGEGLREGEGGRKKKRGRNPGTEISFQSPRAVAACGLH